MEFLKPNWYLGIKFAQGPIFFKILDREIVRVEPIEVGFLDSGQESDLIDPIDPTTRIRYLEPQQTNYFYHVFIGIDPEPIELYLKYPANRDKFGLAGMFGPDKPIKWIDGVTSPFENPAEESELFTFRDQYPVFRAYNPSGSKEYVMLSFHIAKYTYRIVRDETVIQKLVEGRIPCKLWSFTEPIAAPNWLVEQARDVMNIASQYWETAQR